MRHVQTLNRRQVLIGTATLFAATSACAKSKSDIFSTQLAALESGSGGRLGVSILDTHRGKSIGHRANERFTMCSTFKMPLAAAILARADAGLVSLDEMLPYAEADLAGHAPVAKANLAKGAMSVGQCAEAAQVESDNTAANLLLRRIGGPEALTAFFRSIGDRVTRLDRYEPELNASHGSDTRDTTTPGAMAWSLSRILAGSVLKPASRDRLIGWMEATKTGAMRIRAGLPAGWRAGDKTGTYLSDGDFANKYNDIAIIWRPGRPAPFIVTTFLESAQKGGPDIKASDQAVLAGVGRVAAEWIATRS